MQHREVFHRNVDMDYMKVGKTLKEIMLWQYTRVYQKVSGLAA
jgi:hypothetical protein